MSNIRFDYSKALPFVGQHEIDNMAEYVKEAHNMLHNKTGAGNDFLGWVNLRRSRYLASRRRSSSLWLSSPPRKLPR